MGSPLMTDYGIYFVMPFDDELARRYPHIKFDKHWELDDDSRYLLGKCDAIVDVICQAPMQPEARKRLLNVSLVKGAQATTAIEGNTLTTAEVERVSEGASLPRSKEYQEREVRNILHAMNEILESVAIPDSAGVLISPALIKSFHQNVGREL